MSQKLAQVRGKQVIFKKLFLGKNNQSQQVINSELSAFNSLPHEIKQKTFSYMDTIADIIVDEQAIALAKNIIHRYLKFVWLLPASKDHHHASEFGLFLHSFETAINNLKAFEKKLFFYHDKSGSIDSYKTRKVKPKEQYAYFLSGLLADISEASQFIASSGKEHNDPKVRHLISYMLEHRKDFQEAKTGDPWLQFNAFLKNASEAVNEEFGYNEGLEHIDDNAAREVYSYFLSGLLHDIGKASDFIIYDSQEKTWNPYKETLYEFYNKNNKAITIKRIDTYTYALHKKITPVFASAIISHSDCDYIGMHSIADLMDYLMQSGGTGAGNKFSRTIESDMESTKENIETNHYVDAASAVIEEVKNILSSGKYPLNQIMTGAWVFEDYTAVALKILDEARISAASKDEKIKKVIGTKAPLKSFVEKRYVKSEEGWKCMYMMDIETHGRAFQQKVVQFKNTLLWGDNVPETCKLKIKLNISTKD